MQNSEIKVRAISSDNLVDIGLVMRLFKKTFANCYPIQGVYDPQFWQSHIGTRFVSLVGSVGNDVVWHAALHPDKDNPSNMQLAYMVADTERPEVLGPVLEMAWKIINNQALRNNWGLLYHFISATSLPMQALSNQTLGSVEMALCPGYLGCAATPDKRSSVLVAQNIFNSENLPEKTLYAPKHHLDVVSYLYSSLGLARDFEAAPKVVRPIRANLDGLELRYFNLTEVCHATLLPSKLSNYKSLLTELSSHPSKALYLFVDLADPMCPEVCNYIEDAKFRFCGVLPLIQGRDQLIYWRPQAGFKLESSLHSERAVLLASYINSYDMQRALKDAGQVVQTPAAA